MNLVAPSSFLLRLLEELQGGRVLRFLSEQAVQVLDAGFGVLQQSSEKMLDVQKKMLPAGEQIEPRRRV